MFGKFEIVTRCSRTSCLRFRLKVRPDVHSSRSARPLLLSAAGIATLRRAQWRGYTMRTVMSSTQEYLRRAKRARSILDANIEVVETQAIP